MVAAAIYTGSSDDFCSVLPENQLKPLDPCSLSISNSANLATMPFQLVWYTVAHSRQIYNVSEQVFFQKDHNSSIFRPTILILTALCKITNTMCIAMTSSYIFHAYRPRIIMDITDQTRSFIPSKQKWDD